MIDRSLYTPPYVQIEASLAAEAVAWPDGTVPFHSEAAVASRFQVSRMTARRALQGLVERGLLTRARGLGSFVTAPKLVEAFTPTMQVHRAWRTLGLDVEMRVLRFEYLHPGEDACRKLELRRNAKVLYMRRLRLLAGAPIALDDRFIPPAIAKAAKLVRADLAGSILDALWRAGPLSHADWEIEARAADQEEAALLAMSSRRSNTLAQHGVHSFRRRSRRHRNEYPPRRSDALRFNSATSYPWERRASICNS